MEHNCRSKETLDYDRDAQVYYNEDSKEWILSIPYLGTDGYGDMGYEYVEQDIKYCPWCGKKLELE